MAWLAGELNNPDRTDNYLMQIAAEVRRTRYKNPKDVKLQDLKLSFSEKAPETAQESKLPATGSKAVWMGIIRASEKRLEKRKAAKRGKRN